MHDSDTPLLPLAKPRAWAVAGSLNASPNPNPTAAPAAIDGLELFQTAPEATADGYTLWKAAMAEEKAAEQALRRSSELPTQSSAEGFARWKEEAEAARLAFEKRWGVPLGKTVRIQLRGEAHEREGLLRLIEAPSSSSGASSRQLRLTLGGHTFPATQIESLVRL